MFTFDAVADEASKQEEIFAMVGKSITDSCIAGYNGSIFAYGQTGSGKTHTIQGAMTPSGEFLPGMKGLIPRVLDHMYFLMDQSEKASLGSVRFECRCSFLEIYKEKIMDLLNPTMLDLSIREDIKRGIYVENLTEQPVSSTAEALEVLRVGAANRHVAATGCNEFSSRSHSVFTITIKSKALLDDVGHANVSVDGEKEAKGKIDGEDHTRGGHKGDGDEGHQADRCVVVEAVLAGTF
ncbi:Kinesin motor domain containing protein [Acanthamoeba castellanii str. Neff]|uniref:Kinesin motor domain containing protein n=1 Tax=Acanthamoeba castellanii (strain ATCC 30010 / Neff) TaxID=1257118 RepID=L8GH95_ACACF|nr:Kinesin motor domain containing protein [Acanthamoeba castellanii str. Neff]ELR12465.1 Kinesin motor domain containing protein [Acanthamoeba castellanii str. Neff]